MNNYFVILAAGKGKRFHKKHPKHGDYWKDDIEGVHKIRFNFRRTINLGFDIERYYKWNTFT